MKDYRKLMFIYKNPHDPADIVTRAINYGSNAIAYCLLNGTKTMNLKAGFDVWFPKILKNAKGKIAVFAYHQLDNTDPAKQAKKMLSRIKDYSGKLAGVMVYAKPLTYRVKQADAETYMKALRAGYTGRIDVVIHDADLKADSVQGLCKHADNIWLILSTGNNKSLWQSFANSWLWLKATYKKNVYPVLGICNIPAIGYKVSTKATQDFWTSFMAEKDIHSSSLWNWNSEDADVICINQDGDEAAKLRNLITDMKWTKVKDISPVVITPPPVIEEPVIVPPVDTTPPVVVPEPPVIVEPEPEPVQPVEQSKVMLGKSMYIWNIEDIFGGNISQIVSELKAAKFESVILHSTNVNNWRTAKRIELTLALKAAGIKVFAGTAVYLGNEGKAAAGICTQYNLAGFVFDAESAFDKLSTPDSKASAMLKEFRLEIKESHKEPSDFLIGWCWWAFWHKMHSKGTVYHPPKILWAAMARGYGDADFGVPMMYWSWGDSAARATAYLDESWAQWRAITNKPIEPAGRAYVGDGGKAIPEAVIAFEKRARELGATGVTWWVMDHAANQKYVPGVWDALKGLQPFTVTGDEPQPKWYEHMTLDEIIKVLKAHPEWQPESKG